MPNDTEVEEFSYSFMESVKMVMDYSHLDYYSALNLPTDVFLLMRKNYIIDRLKQTEEGKEYLEKCKRLSTTEPELEKVRQKIKQG